MGASKTSLSAGLVIRAVLLEDEAVSAITNQVFPVITESDTLPYIQIRRRSLSETLQKNRTPMADEAEMEITCFTAEYDEGVALAEAVRYALDGIQAEHDGMRMRSCYLIDSGEDYVDDAFVQMLAFRIKV